MMHIIIRIILEDLNWNYKIYLCINKNRDLDKTVNCIISNRKEVDYIGF